jgi:hypothetical protein
MEKGESNAEDARSLERLSRNTTHLESEQTDASGIGATFYPRRPGVIAYAGVTTAIMVSLMSISCFMVFLLYTKLRKALGIHYHVSNHDVKLFANKNRTFEKFFQSLFIPIHP